MSANMEAINRRRQENISAINNKFVQTALLASLEYILEKGIDDVIKETADAEHDLRLFPHVQEKINEYRRSNLLANQPNPTPERMGGVTASKEWLRATLPNVVVEQPDGVTDKNVIPFYFGGKQWTQEKILKR